jgi:hypothetical protein
MPSKVHTNAMATQATLHECVSAYDQVPATISEEQYLRTMFHPDCDFLDGRVEERKVGEWEHSGVQKMLMKIFLRNEDVWGTDIRQECRLQVAAHRFRVPDSMILRAGEQVKRIVSVAPLLCIEVKSPEDTWKRMDTVLRDFLEMGVKDVWVFDPEEKLAYRFDHDGFHPAVGELTVEGTAITVSVDEVFAS